MVLGVRGRLEGSGWAGEGVFSLGGGGPGWQVGDRVGELGRF